MHDIKFENIRLAVQNLQCLIQENISACYFIETCGDYKFVSYYDQEASVMGFSVTDKHFTEIKMLSNMPPELMVAYGTFINNVRQWEAGKAGIPYLPGRPIE
jgi:hypothetical protein